MRCFTTIFFPLYSMWRVCFYLTQWILRRVTCRQRYTSFDCSVLFCCSSLLTLPFKQSIDRWLDFNSSLWISSHRCEYIYFFLFSFCRSLAIIPAKSDFIAIDKHIGNYADVCGFFVFYSICFFSLESEQYSLCLFSQCFCVNMLV